MAYTAEIFGSAIVAVGSFNPAIFSPDWLERNQLIGMDDADDARGGPDNVGRFGKDLLVSQEATTFHTKWFALQVLTNQFNLTSKGALSPAFRDLCVGIFQLVPHTPVSAVGLNFMAHFKLSSDEEYHRIGDVLAPKEIWNSLYPEEMAGLADLTVRIQRGTRDEPPKSKDEKRISIQPSTRVRSGVYVAYNDHRDLSDIGVEALKPAERLAAIVNDEWESAWVDAIRVFDSVIGAALARAR